ncbi:MAG TPA: hypothetical protein VNL14_20060 [Candidatus Acidoferrales bacterium]|nr:hypothetical protein [Candidatus Acidoferrales bacterium]
MIWANTVAILAAVIVVIVMLRKGLEEVRAVAEAVRDVAHICSRDEELSRAILREVAERRTTS